MSSAQNSIRASRIQFHRASFQLITIPQRRKNINELTINDVVLVRWATDRPINDVQTFLRHMLITNSQ